MRVTILLADNCSSMSVAATMEFLEVANALYLYAAGQPKRGKSPAVLAPLFEVETASVDARSVLSTGGLTLTPEQSLAAVTKTDLIIIPGFLFKVMPLLSRLGDIIPWLQHHYEQGAHIASMCTGAFVTAQAGLLAHKNATTHWLFGEKFKSLYPDVQLQLEKSITDDDRILCSGGAATGGDLLLYIVRKFCSPQLAAECSKKLLVDSSTREQTPYASTQFKKQHNDDDIFKVQIWLENQLKNAIQFEAVASQFGFGMRNFIRRFKEATGQTPIHYLQNLRLEKAKFLLETTRYSFDKITIEVGYEDSNSFRRLFKDRVGLSPNAYRKKFLCEAV